MEFPRRVFDGEGVKGDVDFGPTLMLNRNRCILCTRCVRFMRDVDGDAQINIIDRGYGSEIATFQEEGVHSLHLGQPDGRLPGRRDHDARLPVQVAAVGQPERRRHHLHAVLEGLQHHRVDQGQAGVGEGLAADPLHAAVQPRRQRLLDVRHRPLRLPLDRRRRPRCASRSSATRRRAAAGVLARRDRRSCATGSRRPARSNPDGVRFLLSAHASHEELFLFRRLTEELLGDDGPTAIERELAVPREAAAGGHEVQGAGRRRAERQRRARCSAWRRAQSATTCGAADLSALRAAVEAGTRHGALRVRSRAGRLARRHRLDCRGARSAARCRCSSCRACC